MKQCNISIFYLVALVVTETMNKSNVTVGENVSVVDVMRINMYETVRVIIYANAMCWFALW